MSEVSKKQLEANCQNAKLGGIKTEEGKVVIKKSTGAEVLDWVRKNILADCDPDHLFKIAIEKFNAYENAGKKEAEKEGKELMEIASKSLIPLGLETHYALAETIDSRYRSLVIEVARKIEKEYDCVTYAEKALVELITNAYIRVIDNSRRVNNELGGPGQPITKNRTNYLIMLNKEIDNANRQFLNTLVTLKQLKAPSFEMNIRTKTAFISQNQQINAAINPVQQDEIIIPK